MYTFPYKINNFKIFFLFFFIFSVQYELSAQRFKTDLIIGVNGGQVDGDTQNGYSKAGFIAGIGTDAVLNDKSAFRIQLYYTGKGAVKKIEYADGSNFEEFKTNLHYIQLPLMYKYDIFNKISIAGGIAPAYLFKAKLFESRYEVPDYLYDMYNFDLSPIIETEFRFFKKISVNIHFSYSLITIRKDNENWFNNDIGLSLHYKFN